MTTAAQPTPATDKRKAFEISIARDKLITALSAVVGVVPNKATLPVLVMAHIETVPDAGVRITTTDLETVASVTAPADHDNTPSAVLAPAARLLDIVREMPVGVIKIKSAARGLQVTNGRAKVSLEHGPVVEEFPGIPRTDGSRFTIRAGALHTLAQQVAFAASTEESRPILNGVLLQVRAPAEGSDDAPTLRAVGTNGHRLALAEIAVKGAPLDFPNIIVDPRMLSQVQRAFAPEEMVVITSDGRRVDILGEQGRVGGRLIEGPYPDYEKVVPRAGGKSVFVDSAAFQRALSLVEEVASLQTHKVKMTVENGMMRLEAENAGVGEAVHEVPVQWDGEGPFAIAFNAEYLGQVVSKLPEGEVKMEFTKAESAARVTAAPATTRVTAAATEGAAKDVSTEATSAQTMVLMPLRITD